MPPKKAAAPSSSSAEPASPTPVVAPSGKGAANEVGIAVTAKVVKSKTDVYRGLYIRLIGQGIECTNSQIFGDQLPWRAFGNNVRRSIDSTNALQQPEVPETTTDGRVTQLTASYTWPNFDVTTVLKDIEKTKKFHATPGLYAVLLGKKGDEVVDTPISFAYVDCSTLLFESGKQIGRSQSVDGILFEISVVALKPLLEKEQCMGYEPMILHIEKLGGYPVLQDEKEGDALDPVYIYGKLEFGSFTRTIFVRPLSIQKVVINTDNNDDDDNIGNSSSSSSSPQANLIDIDTKFCLLPGLTDLAKFRESLTSATFLLQIHRENLYERSFSIRNVEEWKQLGQQQPVAAKPAGKGMAETGPISLSDVFLVNCIDTAMATASQVNPYGAAKFRLEDLLSSSVDLLKEFSITHAQSYHHHHHHPDDTIGMIASTTGTGDDGHKGLVVVHEDMLLEVRLAKPSKPPKVARPSEYSLRSALERARDQDEDNADALATLTTPGTTLGDLPNTITGTSSSSMIPSLTGTKRKKGMLEETLASATLGRGIVPTSGINSKARHEQFFECSTRLILNAEIHRQLVHPPEVPQVLPDALFKIREQRQYADHYAILANRTEAAIGFTSTMITSQRTGFGNAILEGDPLYDTVTATADTTLSLHPTKLQLLGSNLGLEFDSLNYDLFMSDEVQARLAVTPFTRMVIIFNYEDDDTLLTLNDAIAKVNKKALPDIQGSLRSYALSPEELEAACRGDLDVVTGIMIIDDDTRMVILEGLAKPGGGMQSIFMDLPRPKENDTKFKMLCNPEILFPDRLYPNFGPELKKVRLRDKLKKLIRRPELYNRKQVDEICFESFDSLMTLRRAQNLKWTKDLSMYPSERSLNTLELLYGEAISRADLDGLAAEALRQASIEQKRVEKQARLRGITVSQYLETMNASANGGMGMSGDGMGMMKSMSASGTRSLRLPGQKSGPSDCHNPYFEHHLRTRPLHRVDHLAIGREYRKNAWIQMLHRREKRDQDYAETMEKVLGKDGNQGGKIYLYSTQTLNFKEKAMAEMRKRLGGDNNATYTFSKDFVSQTLTLVDIEADKKAALAQSRAEWLTSKGFRYPAAKTRQDLVTHPKRPTDIVIADLKEPWMGDMPIPVPKGESLEETAHNLLLEKGYTTRVSLGGEVFGGLKAPVYAREYELKLVGDRSKLPRGTLVEGTRHEPDPAFFKSVHLGGIKQAAIIKAAMEKEKADWAAKVVVDDIAFKVGHLAVRDTPLQQDRTSDILHDEPHRKDLKTLRHKTSKSTGKVIVYEPAPLSMFSTGTFVQNEGVENLLRKEDRTRFIKTGDMIKTGTLTGPITKENINLHEVNFTRFIHKNACAPTKLIQMVHTRKHPLQDVSEKTGPRWTAPSSTTSNNHNNNNHNHNSNMSLPPIL